MSLADKYFKDAVNKILTEGYSDETMVVRPHWEDGTPAHTIKTFCYICRYDLSKEFPILTLRRQAFKTMIKDADEFALHGDCIYAFLTQQNERTFVDELKNAII